MKSNAVVIISLNAWKRPADKANSVPRPIAKPMKPSSPTAKNPIILLKSVCVKANEIPKIIAIAENTTSNISKKGNGENILNIINTIETIEPTVNA